MLDSTFIFAHSVTLKVAIRNIKSIWNTKNVLGMLATYKYETKNLKNLFDIEYKQFVFLMNARPALFNINVLLL